MEKAFKYVEKNGIHTEQDYPYHGKDESCKDKASPALFNISSYVTVGHGKENELQQAVATIGPISVAVHATYIFASYSKGKSKSFEMCLHRSLHDVHRILTHFFAII